MKAYSSERHGYFGRNVWRGKKEKKKGSEEGTVEDKYIFIYIYTYILFVWDLVEKEQDSCFQRKEKKRAASSILF